jgi:hypothetical protein
MRGLLARPSQDTFQFTKSRESALMPSNHRPGSSFFNPLPIQVRIKMRTFLPFGNENVTI